MKKKITKEDKIKIFEKILHDHRGPLSAHCIAQEYNSLNGKRKTLELNGNEVSKMIKTSKATNIIIINEDSKPWKYYIRR